MVSSNFLALNKFLISSVFAADSANLRGVGLYSFLDYIFWIDKLIVVINQWLKTVLNYRIGKYNKVYALLLFVFRNCPGEMPVVSLNAV